DQEHRDQQRGDRDHLYQQQDHHDRAAAGEAEPGQCRWANRPSRIETATVMKTTITLLRRLSRKLVWVMATMKLCRVGWLGKNVGVDVITSERGLKAVLIIQYTGKTHTRLNRMPRVFARQCRRLRRRGLVGWEMLTGPPPIAAGY